MSDVVDYALELNLMNPFKINKYFFIIERNLTKIDHRVTWAFFPRTTKKSLKSIGGFPENSN